ncbi:PREDICTED: uncharacterized protein LOC104800607 [Tarenaya hassleriana]|uniref:uncharacterized protein LOC104800607 n=1 Tax=Tarenaya hassleriana TaxID=28532 RepID=UPI00053C561D|nr:PREDICTED: uncharacterized protein LOC104800607 [Tarenaya hassleriana]
MNLVTFLLLLLSSLALAQDRAPHGLTYESPMAFSPSAFEFFHAQPENPDAKLDPCAESGCSPLPVAAKVQGAAAQAQESKIASMSSGSSSRISAGGVAGIIFGLAFAVFSAMGAYYVVRKRHGNANPSNSVQPDV